MKFYCASKYEDRKETRVLMGELIDRGHKITCDWTVHYPKPVEERKWFYSLYAIEDIKGIRECDALVALFINEHHYRGAWIEIGGALALGKPVYIIGHGGDGCLFLYHPNIHKFENTAEFLRSIEEIK